MNDILKFYQEECDESTRLKSQSGQIEYITTMNYLSHYCEKGMKVLDACAGGGVYSFPLANMGCEVTAGDLIDVNVQHIVEINKKDNILKDVYQGSVLDLSRFPDEYFDVVLNLGSYYHLCNKEDRTQALRETLRVLKPNGVYFLAYINRCANYMAHLEEFKNDLSFLQRYMTNGYIDHNNVFYSTTPELIQQEISEFPLIQLHNIAADGPMFLYREILDTMNEEEFTIFIGIHMQLCDKPSNLGFSEHALIIAKKEELNNTSHKKDTL
jgi:ubiquinone/menaquinone biosynthesis C-methylase UbiE